MTIAEPLGNNGCARTGEMTIPPRLFSHRATPVKVVRAPRGSTFPGGRFPLVAALLGASARDSACRGKARRGYTADLPERFRESALHPPPD